MGTKKNKKGKQKKIEIKDTKGKIIKLEKREKEQKKEEKKEDKKEEKKEDNITEIKTVSTVSKKEEKISKQDKYFYVYGITNDEDIKLDLKGLRGKPIQKFNFRDTAVLFSFYPDLHPIVEESEAMHHAEILNKLAGRITIIPMAFGTVFKNREILETILTKSYLTAKRTLGLIKDKVELGMKVVKKEGEEMPEGVNKEILDELGGLSVKSIQGDKFSERLLLNHSFLVERKKFTQFSDKVGELEQKHQNLKFIYTGPWPAYSFVNININAG